jgi:hypothetical protein
MSSRAPRALAALVAALAGLAGLAALGGCASPPPPHPAGLAGDPPWFIQAEALAAAEVAGSAHVQMTSTSASGSTVYSTDVSANAGRQVITITGGGQATVLDVAGVGYVTGNPAALVSFFGFPAAVSARLTGRWVSFRSGQPYYAQIVDALTLGSALGVVTLSGRLASEGRRGVMDGQPVVGVRGVASRVPGVPAGTRATLYVATAGRLLPVSFREVSGGLRLSAVFSRWGEAVSVSAPRDAIPITTAMGSRKA